MDANLPGICAVGVNEQSFAQGKAVTYPNPFGNALNIGYKIPWKSHVKIELMNALGEGMKIVFEGERTTGMYNENITTADLSVGAYILKLTINEDVYFQKLIKVADN
jgi:hypothetical protein